jgi:hypothetical protein
MQSLDTSNCWTRYSKFQLISHANIEQKNETTNSIAKSGDKLPTTNLGIIHKMYIADTMNNAVKS